jgi:hypothetical protein
MYDLQCTDEFQGDFEFEFTSEHHNYLIDIDSEDGILDILFYADLDKDFSSTNKGLKEMIKVMDTISQAVQIASRKTGINKFSFNMKDESKKSFQRLDFYNRTFKKKGFSFLKTGKNVIYSK